MAEDIIGHDPITMRQLRIWGYCPFKKGRKYFVNWNGVWLKQISDGVFEYGSPNYHTIDETHPFVSKGDVEYMDELNELNGDRGLEYISYNNYWKQ